MALYMSLHRSVAPDTEDRDLLQFGYGHGEYWRISGKGQMN